MPAPPDMFQANPGPQTDFLSSVVPELLFGGALGGGKTLALMVDPLSQLKVEMERFQSGAIRSSAMWAIHFRREMPRLAQTIALSHLMYKPIGGKYNENAHVWTFPNAGNARIQFAHLEGVNDHLNYGSFQFTAVYFDELTEFLEEQYLYILLRLRTTDFVLGPRPCPRHANPGRLIDKDCAVRNNDYRDETLCWRGMLVARSGTNPVGDGRDWVRARFVDPAPAGRKIIRSRVTLKSGEVIDKDRMFIPSRLSDNPHIPKDYEATIADRPPHIRRALLDGDWYVDTASYFGDDWVKSLHVVRPFQIPVSWPRFRSCDFAPVRWSSVSWWAVDPDGNMVCYRHLSARRHDAMMLGHRIMEAEKETDDWEPSSDGGNSRLTGPLDPACWSPNPTGPTIAEVFFSMGISFYKADHNRIGGWNQLVTRLRARRPSQVLAGLITDDEGKPTAHKLFPMIMWFSTCHAPIRYIPALPADEDNPDDVDTRARDDEADDARYACMSRPVSADSEDRPWYEDSPEDELAARRQATRRSGQMGYGGWSVLPILVSLAGLIA